MKKAMLLVMMCSVFLVACADPVTECFKTCNGCCNDKAECMPGNTTTACGIATAVGGGDLCRACATGQVCTAGMCVAPTCSSLVGTIYAVTGSGAAFAGSPSGCGDANGFIPSGMQVSFFANGVATLRASGNDLTCSYSQANCSTNINCVADPSNSIGFNNVVIAADGRSFTGDALITRPNNMCNVTFRVAGSR